MTDSLEDLPLFGHYGRISYDQENGRWHSQNDRLQHPSIHSFGVQDTYIRPAKSLGNEGAKSARAKEQDASKTANEIPEFGPAQRVLIEGWKNVPQPEHLAQSEQHLVGDVFDCSEIFDATLSRSFPVFAFASRECKGDILVLKGRALEQGWVDDASVYVESMEVEEEGALKLNQENGNIFQICLSQADGNGHLFLAVRYQKTFKVCELEMEKPRASVSQKQKKFREFQSDLRLVQSLEIDLSDVHSDSLADVQFHQLDPSKVALVDTHGHWSIWDLFRKGRLQSKMLSDGDLTRVSQIKAEYERTNDGWHRVLWLTSPALLVVCWRSGIQLLRLLDPSLPGIGFSLDMSHYCRPQTNLDVRPSLANEDEFFVLTNSHVHRFRVNVYSSKDDRAQKIYHVNRLVSVEHHRGDSGLKLQLFFDADMQNAKTHAILFSRDNDLVTEYCFQPFKERNDYPMAGSTTPRKLNHLIHDQQSGDRGDLGLVSITIRSVPRRVKNTGSALNQTCDENDVHFAQAFMFTRDFALRSLVYYSSKGGLSRDARLRPLDRKRDIGLKATPGAAQAFTVNENFIMPDEDNGVLVMRDSCSVEGWQCLVQPSWYGEGKPSGSDLHGAAVSSELIYEEITRTEFITSTEMSEIASSMRTSLITAAQEADFCPQTLTHLLCYNIHLSDVEAANAAFQTAMRNGIVEFPDPSIPLSISTLELPKDNELNGLYGSNFSLSTIYQSLIENWLGPLPPTASGITRITKEKVAREVAALVFLSSIIIYWQPTSGSQQLHPPQRILQQLLASALLPQHKSEPTLSHPATAHAKQQQEAEDTNASPPTIAGILSHWNLVADPFNYDSNAPSDNASGITTIQKQRRRFEHQIQRDEDRRRKRLRTERRKAASQSQILGGNGWDSSQAQRPMEMQTHMKMSQGREIAEAAHPNVVASQILPGAFGGRHGLVVRRSRPKRKAGF